MSSGLRLLGATTMLVVCAHLAFASYQLKELADTSAQPTESSMDIRRFVDRFPYWFCKSLDLSPNGRTLATVYQTTDNDDAPAIWLTLWDVHTKQLSEAKRLETWAKGQYNRYYAQQIRFAPDGQSLFVLTGPRLLALEFPSLKMRYTIETPVPLEQMKEDFYLYRFGLAAEAPRLGIVLVKARDRWKEQVFEFRLLDSETGKMLHSWESPGHADSIALSPDATRAAISENPIWRGARVPADKKNVFVFETATGNILQAFNTDYTSADAIFVRHGQQLLTIAEDQPNSKYFASETVKLWDTASLRLLKEFRYGKHGVRGSLQVSTDGKRLAVVTRRANPFDVRWHRYATRGYARFLVWDFESGDLLHASRDLPGGSRWGDLKGDFHVALSNDGKTLVVGREHITVYRFSSE